MAPRQVALQQGFELGPWTVIPERGLLRMNAVEEHLEPMVMDVLVVLADHQGDVVTRDQLVDAVWDGRFVADEAIVAKIATLRNKLKDDSRHPEFIETVPRRGYRLKQPVKTLQSGAPRKRVSRSLMVAVLAVAIAAGIYFWPKPVDSVAVLQFTNLSDDPDKFQHFVAGFREELVISLINVPGLRVARGPGWSDEHSAHSQAAALGVDALVNGSLRTDGDRVRVTVELISADGFHIWTDGFDGAVDDMFTMQEWVATKVRDALQGNGGEQIRAASRPASFAALDAYMRGIYFLNTRDLDSLRLARDLFREAIAADPDFGPSYLRLAITYLLLSDYNVEQGHPNGLPQRMRLIDDAIRVVDEGVTRDPSIGNSANIVRGVVAHQLGNWAEAAKAFAATFNGVTIYPDAYHWHSRLLGDIGMTGAALEQALAARRMEPAQQILNSRVAIAYLWNNDIENASLYFDMANKQGVGAPDHHFAYALFLLRQGRFEAARQSVKFALELARMDDRWVDPVIDGLANPDKPEAVQNAHATIDALVRAGASPYITMTLWSLFDQGDRIMEIAKNEAAAGNIYELEVIFLDEFSELREHEDFPELLQTLGLTDYWSSVGCRWSDNQLLCESA